MMQLGIEIEELIGRARDLLVYDGSAPLIFNSGLFLFLFVLVLILASVITHLRRILRPHH